MEPQHKASCQIWSDLPFAIRRHRRVVQFFIYVRFLSGPDGSIILGSKVTCPVVLKQSVDKKKKTCGVKKHFVTLQMAVSQLGGTLRSPIDHWKQTIWDDHGWFGGPLFLYVHIHYSIWIWKWLIQLTTRVLATLHMHHRALRCWFWTCLGSGSALQNVVISWTKLCSMCSPRKQHRARTLVIAFAPLDYTLPILTFDSHYSTWWT